MRLNIGDEVTLFNQKSGQWLAIIKNIKKNVVSAEVIKKISSSMANNINGWKTSSWSRNFET